MESPTPPPALPSSASAVTQDEKTLGIVMHVLCLIGFPIIGPLIVWLMKKDQSHYLDKQGRELLNFQISYFLYALGSALLCVVLIGIPLLFAVAIATLVLTIIGIVRASEGTVYRFPLTIRML
ncbi:MAG: DUF4870 domain-containing protein [Verrucomicrobiaceae bacterium]